MRSRCGLRLPQVTRGRYPLCRVPQPQSYRPDQGVRRTDRPPAPPRRQSCRRGFDRTRAPSSSAQLTTATLLGGGVEERSRPSRTARPAHTPSAPSSQPPAGTESRWEPRTIRESDSPGSSTQILPARSRSALRPKRSACSSSCSLARSQVGVQASRRVTSSPPVWASSLTQIGENLRGQERAALGDRDLSPTSCAAAAVPGNEHRHRPQ